MEIIRPKTPETMVAHYIVCDACEKEIVKVDECFVGSTINGDRTITSHDWVRNVCRIHTEEAGHIGGSYNILYVIATFECIICREICGSRDNISNMESWATEHEKNTGHSYFKFNYDHKVK